MVNKKELRHQLRAERRQIHDKSLKDAVIAQRLCSHSFEAFVNAATVLCYLSLPEEIQTDVIIRRAWEQGKTVAVPLCTPEKKLEFYILDDFSQLCIGAYGIREPDPRQCRKLTDYSRSVCLVPGIAFTVDGARLGYGGGYYDKFLKNYPFFSIGLCYNSLIQQELPMEEFDISVTCVLTETQCFGNFLEA